MTNLRDTAKAHEPIRTLNVTDLEALSLEAPIEERTAEDKEGKPFSYKVAMVLGKEYRVPASVLTDIKTLLEAKPSLKTVRVIKKGTGMNTKYTVIPVE